MINSANSALYQAPKTLHAICVCVPNHVDFLAVFDALVGVSVRHVADAVVGLILIGKDGCVRKDVFLNQTEKSGAFRVCGNQRTNAAFALQYANDGSFLFVTGSGFAFDATSDATEVGLIHLDAAALRATQAAVVV